MCAFAIVIYLMAGILSIRTSVTKFTSIMKNKRFKKAFRMVDRRFAKTASILDRRLEELASSIHDAGFNVYLDGDFLHISNGLFAPGVGLFLEEHNRLAKALAQKKYKAVEKKLGLTPVTIKAPKFMTREQAEAEWKKNHPDESEEDDESMLLQAASVG